MLLYRTAMLLYLFFDSLLSTCPKKNMETGKWPKAADSPLHGQILTKNPTVLQTTLLKIQILRSITRYTHLLTENI